MFVIILQRWCNDNLTDTESFKSKIKITQNTSVITNSTCVGRFTITDTKLYVPLATLSTQDNP